MRAKSLLLEHKLLWRIYSRKARITRESSLHRLARASKGQSFVPHFTHEPVGVEFFIASIQTNPVARERVFVSDRIGLDR